MRRITPLAITLLAAAAGCRGATPEHGAQQGSEPWTRAPADVSHGEAPVGQAGTPAPKDPRAPAPDAAHLHRVRLEMRHARLDIAPGVRYEGWTFDGRVPGPVLRVTEGDTIDFTLINGAPIPHSMDFHAAEIAPSRAYVNVLPGDSVHYRFVAHVPGAFLYHCGTAPVAMHIANGMYGAIIVDPRRAREPAQEFVFVQSEFYPGAHPDSGSVYSLDWNRLLGLAPEFVVFNGVAQQYADHPIRTRPGDLLRLFVVNAGPNRISAFHVVGAIFSRVYVDAVDAHALEGVQTMDVPVGGGMVFETRLAEPGIYPFVTHAFADATKGAVGMFEAEPGSP
jgi:nitrite reductase (NO-forming)